MSENYYITTAIDYVNSTPHIGTAYEKIGADALARFCKMLGKNVRLQMGNDEHSTNVKKAAAKAGLEPLKYCHEMEKKFTDTWRNLDIAYDGFIRTTDPEHKISVQTLFQRIMDSGDIYKDTYEGWYCESCEAFLTDKDLEDGKCPNHKTTPEWLKEDNYFFKLSKYEDPLLNHIKRHPEFIQPEVRRNEVRSMIEMGLQNISVSRASVDWGIPLPNDDKHVVYVWFDALINYITAVGFGTDEKLFKKWWPADVHIIGKDIIRFHCVIWPAMLMSAGIPLPKTVFAHGFVCQKGEKMSKSLGNVLTPLDITKDFGPDPLRYYLLREVPFGKDADFTWEHFIERYNGDLANGIGNLVSRTVGMTEKYLGGVIPPHVKDRNGTGKQLRKTVLEVADKTTTAMEITNSGIQFNVALASIWEGITAADRYINENKPWELNKKGDTERIKTVLSNVVESIRILTALLHPFLPQTAEKIWKQFGFDTIEKITGLKLKDLREFNFITKETKVASQQTLFPRIGEKKEEKDAPKEKKREEKKMTDENLIDIGDFAKVELRVAKVLEAERVEGADKLLKLQVSLGNETRQIVAGIAKSYEPDELIGKKIVVVANLKTAKLRGVESQGMLLAASNEETVSILTPLIDVPEGSRVK